MMGRQDRDQGQLFYEFSLDEMVPTDRLLRRINVFVAAVLADLHQQLGGFYSEIGRPSIDPELMIRMLLVGYCYGIRHERRLCQEVALHLAYRWFCKIGKHGRDRAGRADLYRADQRPFCTSTAAARPNMALASARDRARQALEARERHLCEAHLSRRGFVCLTGAPVISTSL